MSANDQLAEYLEKAGPFIGPRGGKWADAQHKIPWKEEGPSKPTPSEGEAKPKGARDINPKMRKMLRDASKPAGIVAGGMSGTFAQVYRADDHGLLEVGAHGIYKLTAKGREALTQGWYKPIKKVKKSMDANDQLAQYLEKGHTTVGHPYAHVGEEDPEQERLVEEQAAPTREAFSAIDMVKNKKKGVKKADDGKPGESLGETNTGELKATYDDLAARLKKKPDDPAMQARYKAIGAELKKRGGGMKKALFRSSDLVKNMYGRADQWANQFMGTPLYVQALQLSKKKMQLERERAKARKKQPSWSQMDEMPRAKRQAARAKKDAAMDKYNKREDELYAQCADLDEKLLDHRIKEEKARKSMDAADHLGEYLEKGESKKALPSEEAKVSPEKARQILRDGEVHGHPLTEAQRGMFGAIAGKGAKKSMFADGNDQLAEYLEKAGEFRSGGSENPTLESTITKPKYKGLGEETGAIPGDDALGIGGMPHGATNYDGVGPEDGKPVAGVGMTSGDHTGDAGPGQDPSTGQITGSKGKDGLEGKGKLSPDDEDDEGQMKTHKKPIEGTTRKSTTPANQRDMVAQDNAAAAAKLRKGGDDVEAGRGVTPQPQAEETLEKGQQWSQGLVGYSDESDVQIDRFQKSDSFYHGDRPGIGKHGLIRKSRLCKSGHRMPAMLSACPSCGEGAQLVKSALPAPLVKSRDHGLHAPADEDLYLPAGTK